MDYLSGRENGRLDTIRETMDSLAHCLASGRWLSAAVSLDETTLPPEDVLASFSDTSTTRSLSASSSDSAEQFCDALLAERDERRSWERNRIETRRFFATYEILRSPSSIVYGYYATTDGYLRGAAFFLDTPPSRDALIAFRSLFDSVAEGEARKKIVSES